MKSSVMLRILPVIVSVVLFTAGCEFERDSGLPVDGDGNVYDTVVIGTQVWLKENLKTTRFRDGTPIPLVTDNNKWASMTSAAYCWYNNNPVYKDNYGALYNWYAVRTNICPVGWHVPSKEEWETLINYLGGMDIAYCKLRDSKFWQFYQSNPPRCNNIFNESGFTARPGGARSSNDGTSNGIGTYGYWWTSSGTGENAWIIEIYYGSYLTIKPTFKKCGLSIRCIKNN
ncbi:MAG: fibrobacter succinogenes major paralogous domain-containing protein [Bacteroidales bacterium]